MPGNDRPRRTTRWWLLVSIGLWIALILLLCLFPATVLFWYILALGSFITAFCFGRMYLFPLQRDPGGAHPKLEVAIGIRFMIMELCVTLLFVIIAFFQIEQLLHTWHALPSLNNRSFIVIDVVAKSVIGGGIIGTTVQSIKLLYKSLQSDAK